MRRLMLPLLLLLTVPVFPASFAFGPEFPVSPQVPPRIQTHPAVTVVDGAIVAAWMERLDKGPYEVKLGHPGSAPVTVAQAYAPEWLDVVYGGHTVWVVWTDIGAMYVRRYTADFQPIDPEPFHDISRESFEGSNAQSAAAGDDSLIVTWDTYMTDDGYQVAATVIRGAGAELIAVPVVTLSTPAFQVENYSSQAAWNGSEFVVAWLAISGNQGNDPPAIDSSTIAVRRMSRDGVPLDAAAFNAFQDHNYLPIGRLRLTAAGSRLVMVWNQADDRTLAGNYEQGQTITPHVLATSDYWLASASVAANGDLDVYWTIYAPDPGDSTLRYERFSPDFVSRGSSISPPFLQPELELQLDSAVAGNTPVVAYSRLAGGQARVFLRTGSPMRRRVVR